MSNNKAVSPAQGVRMTKAEVLCQFRRYAKPRGSDKPAIRQAWCNYVDLLCRDGMITNKQAATWTNPFH